MEDLFVGVLLMLVVLTLIPLYFWKRRIDSRTTHEHEEEPQDVRGERVVRASNGRRMRRRGTAAASSSSAAANIEETIDGSDEDAEGDGYYAAKASKKKEKKRQEREERRQAEDAARDTRKTKQDHYDEMRRRKDEEREARERKLEEEALARKAKEEEAAALELEKWKGEFSVDAEGTTETEVQNDGSQGLLADFVEYIKKHKCVPLEDIAAEFKLRTQDCINRINSLESTGRLSGVMDDRGKYIYISMEEMKAVADYIKREGRVSISHLASKSNQFIDLEPKSQLVEQDISSIEQVTFA